MHSDAKSNQEKCKGQTRDQIWTWYKDDDKDNISHQQNAKIDNFDNG